MLYCLSGCLAKEATGEWSVAVYGEEFIEEGINSDFFADDWAVEFDKFLMVVGQVGTGFGDRERILVEEFQVFDLSIPSGGSGYQLATVEARAGAFSSVTFEVAGQSDATAANAASADVEMMNQNGYAIYVSGTAVLGAATKTFQLGFTDSTKYADCHGTTELEPDGEATTELTIHADHLFYDDYTANDPGLAFDVFAGADDNGDGDGVITWEEMEAVDITGLDGYESEGKAADLRAYVELLASSLGHVDGEPHCEMVTRNP